MDTLVIRRTKFSDGYLLQTVEAVALASREPRPACIRIVNLIHDSFRHYTWTGFYLRRDTSLTLEFYRGAVATLPEPQESLDGLLGWALRSRRTQIIPDAAIDPRYAHIEIPIKSEIIVPLRFHGRPAGVLDICSERPRAFDRLDLDLLEAAGSALAPLAALLTTDAPALQMPRRAQGFG